MWGVYIAGGFTLLSVLAYGVQWFVRMVVPKEESI